MKPLLEIRPDAKGPISVPSQDSQFIDSMTNIPNPQQLRRVVVTNIYFRQQGDTLFIEPLKEEKL